ncbi:hypothetical protein ACIBH1_35770 [Nonomuraea sp. NPDC050663]
MLARFAERREGLDGTAKVVVIFTGVVSVAAIAVLGGRTGASTRRTIR